MALWKRLMLPWSSVEDARSVAEDFRDRVRPDFEGEDDGEDRVVDIDDDFAGRVERGESIQIRSRPNP